MRSSADPAPALDLATVLAKARAVAEKQARAYFEPTPEKLASTPDPLLLRHLGTP